MKVYYLNYYSTYVPIVREVINLNGPVFTPKRTKLKGYQKRK